MKSICFHRKYYGYTGGHQKVRDYLQHTAGQNDYKASLFLDNQANTEHDLFDAIEHVHYQQEYDPIAADIVFLAGMDWDAYLPFLDPTQIKINLIQHVRHGDANHPLNRFLQYRAIRLCVSDAVKDAIQEQANGPCITVKMGHQIDGNVHVRELSSEHIDLYILANKQPKLGETVRHWAERKGMNVVCHNYTVPKQHVLHNMKRATITLALPNKTEGFYLPGIEAMALSRVVVVPDCIANREYMQRGANAIMVNYDLTSIKKGIDDAMVLNKSTIALLSRFRGRKIANQYQLQRERHAFLQVLKNIKDLY